jgi:hypothetical protein
MNKKFCLFLLIVIVLSSCTQIHTPDLPTATRAAQIKISPIYIPTETPKIIKSTTPEVTVTPVTSQDMQETRGGQQNRNQTETQTATLSVTPTLSDEEYSEAFFKKKLSELALVTDDIPTLSPDYPNIFMVSPYPYQDLTDELGKNCGRDCIKRVWTPHDNGTEKLYLIMMRERSNLAASLTVDNLYRQFTQNAPDEDFVDTKINHPDELPINTKVGGSFIGHNIQLFLIASKGPVVLLVVENYKTSGCCELYMDPDIYAIQNFSSLQFSKLSAAGYPE